MRFFHFMRFGRRTPAVTGTCHESDHTSLLTQSNLTSLFPNDKSQHELSLNDCRQR